jgi:hypothetical protein
MSEQFKQFYTNTVCEDCADPTPLMHSALFKRHFKQVIIIFLGAGNEVHTSALFKA